MHAADSLADMACLQAASKEELLEMIRFGADTVIRMGDIEDTEFDIEDVSFLSIFACVSSYSLFCTFCRGRYE